MGYIVLLIIVGSVAEQTDWMGGDGVPGPVTNWGSRYFAGDSITAASEGRVSLVATQWDYTASGWVKHTVESNSGIQNMAQGMMPVDMDGDVVLDLVAHTNDEVVWYSGNYVFSKNVIGPADDGGDCHPCVYPCDLDKDNDIDVLVATNGVGVGWYENPLWVYHTMDNSIGYHRVSAVDVELDGDLDIIAVDNNSSGTRGDIYLFRDTTGFQDFKKELAIDLPSSEGWRAYSTDFNADEYPDIYSVYYNAYIFLNDGTGQFIQAFHGDYSSGIDFDGAWPIDIDMDGDMDLVCGGTGISPYGFYALLNDGTGWNFDSTLLVEDVNNYYTDGSMARDIDLDGLPDIGGTWKRVGWFRQDPSNPLTFTLYDIGDVDDSHWLYVASLCNKCRPSMDLLVTDKGAHIVYENQMLEAFASLGYLESSILELPSDSTYELNYFGYEACVPNDTALAFYWRAGADSADIASKPWGSPHYVTTVGMPCVVDSFSMGLDGVKMFQYKVEFKGGDDIAVLYKVWLNYEYGTAGIEEESKIKIQNAKLETYPNPSFGNTLIKYELPEKATVSLSLYDISGRLVKVLHSGVQEKGYYTISLSRVRGPDLPTGVYFIKFMAGNFKATKKLTILR